MTAFTYPLDLPTTIGPSRIVLIGNDIVGVSVSPFTAQAQFYDWGANFWRAEIDLPRMPREYAEDWVAFLLELRGMLGTFRMGDPAGAVARGALGGVPIVDGAGQSGHLLYIRGCTPGVTGWLKKGDYVQVGDYLYRSVSEANTDGTGRTTLALWPRLRVAYADGTALVTASAKGLWRLAANERQWEVSAPFEYGITLQAVEALPNT